MSAPDLRLVSDNPGAAKPAISVETFTFVRGEKAVMVYHDGRLVDAGKATELFAIVMRELIDKSEALMCEIANTPGAIR